MTIEHMKKHTPDSEAISQQHSESKEKFELLMELSNDGIVIIQDGHIKECNHYMVKLCNYSVEEVIDTDFLSYFNLDDLPAALSLCERSLQNENAIEMLEATLICKNGHKISVEISAGRLNYHGKPANLLVVRDISERVTIPQKPIKNKTPAAIGAFAGRIAHKYNNALTAIVGNISLAQSCLNPDDKIYKSLERALAASRKAQNLSERLFITCRTRFLTMKIL